MLADGRAACLVVIILEVEDTSDVVVYTVVTLAFAYEPVAIEPLP
jgi:hypothetical protein